MGQACSSCGGSGQGANVHLEQQWRKSNMDDESVNYWLDREPLLADWDVTGDPTLDLELYTMAHKNWELKSFCHGLPEQQLGGGICTVPNGLARFAVIGLPGHGKSSLVTNILNACDKSTVYKPNHTNGQLNVVESEEYAPIGTGGEHCTLGSMLYPNTETNRVRERIGDQIQIVDVMGINADEYADDPDDEKEDEEKTGEGAACLRLVQQTVDNFVRGYTRPGDMDVWASAYGMDVKKPEIKTRREHKEWQRERRVDHTLEPAKDRVQCIVFLISATDEPDAAFAAFKSILNWRGKYHSETGLSIHCLLAVSKVDRLGTTEEQAALRENPKLLADGDWGPFEVWRDNAVLQHNLDVVDIFPILDRKSILRSIKNPMDARFVAIDNLTLGLTARIRKRSALTREKCINKAIEDERRQQEIDDQGDEVTITKGKVRAKAIDKKKRRKIIAKIEKKIEELENLAEESGLTLREEQEFIDEAKTYREHLTKFMAGGMQLEELERILGGPQAGEKEERKKAEQTKEDEKRRKRVADEERRKDEQRRKRSAEEHEKRRQRRLEEEGGGRGPVYSEVPKQRNSQAPGSTRPRQEIPYDPNSWVSAEHPAPAKTSHSIQPKLKQAVNTQRMSGLPGSPMMTSEAGYPILTHHDAPRGAMKLTTSEGMTGGETRVDLQVGDRVEAQAPETLKDIYGEWKTATIMAIEGEGYYLVQFDSYRESNRIHYLQMRRGNRRGRELENPNGRASSRVLNGAPSSPPFVRTQSG